MEVGRKELGAAAPTPKAPDPESPRPARRAVGTSSWVPVVGLLGSFLLSAMFILFALSGSFGLWNWVTGAAGVVLIVAYFSLDAAHWGEIVRTRRFLIGANALLVTVLAILLWGFVNYINQRHYRRWDLTKSGRFTLSDRTRDILKSLDKDVKITSLVRPQGRNADVDAILNGINDFLEEYKAASPHVSLEIVDPFGDRERAIQIAERLKISEDDLFSVIFERGDRTKRVGVDEIVEQTAFNPYNPSTEPPKFKGEEAFTSAILNVVEDKQTTLYFVTGHDEAKTDDFRGRGGLGQLSRTLQRQNLKVADVPTDTGNDLPADCDVLVIAAPKRPYSEAEKDVLKRYLDKGGKLLVMLDLVVDPTTDSGLGALLESYGVDLGNDIVIETDPRHTFPSYPVAVLIDTFGFHPITDKLKNLRVLFDQTRSVDAASDTKGWDVTSLLKSSAHSWAESDVQSLRSSETRPQFDEGTKDKKGPVSLAVAVSKKSTPGSNEPPSGPRYVVTGDADFAGNDTVAVGSYANADLILNSINWLASREKLISIGAKVMDNPTVKLSAEQSSHVFWFSVAILPGLGLVLAGVVYVMRRR